MTDWRRAGRCEAGNCVEVAFVKSRASCDTGCVEVAQCEHKVKVRDSKNPNGPVLTFTPHEWDAFTDGVRRGDFDPPTP